MIDSAASECRAAALEAIASAIQASHGVKAVWEKSVRQAADVLNALDDSGLTVVSHAEHW